MVGKVLKTLKISERRACQVLGQARSTQRHIPHLRSEEERLSAEIIKLATRYGRYGYRRITALLRQESWRVNHKRVERIWSREGLKVPKKQPKRGRFWLNDGSCTRLKISSTRTMCGAREAMVARTADDRAFRMLTIIDEYTRECLAILVDRRITSQNVIEELFYLFIFRGAPEYIRSDNGPEFTAKAIRRWLNRLEVNTLFIERGSPWENGYIELFNGKLRDELLNREIFTSLTEAKILIEEWRNEYNQVRPHGSLNYRPPAPEATIQEFPQNF